MTGARVLLVEDNDVYRATLELLLGQERRVQVVGSVADGPAGVEAAGTLRPDVVLVDYRLPGLNGAEATRAITGASPASAVICLTAEATDDERAAVIAAGAVAVVEKGAPTSVLLEAIRSASRPGPEGP
mgnify:CR=1 FL=1